MNEIQSYEPQLITGSMHLPDLKEGSGDHQW